MSDEKRNLPAFVCKRIGRMDPSTGTVGLLAIAPPHCSNASLSLSLWSLPVAAGAPEVSQCSCMKSLGVSRVCDFAGLLGLNGNRNLLVPCYGLR